jgi:hypothetical protein
MLPITIFRVRTRRAALQISLLQNAVVNGDGGERCSQRRENIPRGEALFGGVSQAGGIISRRQGRLFQCTSIMRLPVAGRRGGTHDLA